VDKKKINFLKREPIPLPQKLDSIAINPPEYLKAKSHNGI
jgi:hypothetical protein